MSGRVERWLQGSERTPDRTVDERRRDQYNLAEQR